MQMIINISEKMYEDCKVRNTLHYSIYDFSSVITNGIPLPKGHGRLIDSDKAIREVNSKLIDFDIKNIRDRSCCKYARMILNNAPTIIEAEGAWKNDKRRKD